MEQGFLAMMAEGMLLMLQAHGSFVVYFGVFLLGENAILAASMLAAQEYLSPQTVFLCALLGLLSADIFWYGVCVKVAKRFYEKKVFTQETSEQKMFLLRIAEQHTFLFLTFIKFLVGMRLFLTIYILLKKDIPFVKYLLINIAGTALFVGALFPLGWYLGKGISFAFAVEKGITSFISVFIVAVFLFHVLPRLFTLAIGRYMKKVETNGEDKTPA